MRVLRAPLVLVALLGAVIVVSFGVHAITRRTFSAGKPAGATSTTSVPAATTTTLPPIPHPVAGLSWVPLGQPTSGRAPMEIAVIAGGTSGPTQVAVWLDASLVRAELIPGLNVPGGRGWNPIGEVPVAARSTLLAAFNGGALLTEAKGGFYAQGKTGAPLVAGAASLVIRTNGTATVGMWGRDASLGPDVAAVRQDLTLLVDGGAESPDVAKPAPYWGVTPAADQVVTRSGVGVDAAGNLVWIGGDGLTPTALAGLFVKAGCVRAMQLDINHRYVIFNTYAVSSSGVVQGTKVLPGAYFSGDRYLTPDLRDFVTVQRR